MKHIKWLIIIFFTLLGFSLRSSNISMPSKIFFDETYYVKAAKTYLAAQPDTNYVHPPLAKILISMGINMFGDNPFGWRIASAVFGSLTILVILLLAWQIFKNYFGLISCGIMACFEFLIFTESRIAKLDIFLVFFIILAFYLFYLYLEDPKKFKINIIYTVICLGLASSCKWSAIFYAAGIFFIYLLYRKTTSQNYIKPVNFILFLFFGIILVYLLCHIPFFAKGGTFLKLYKNHLKTLHFHFKEEFKHGYLSSVLSWPLMIRPIWYFYEEIQGSLCQGIIAMGNPFFWWSFLAFFTYLIFNFIKTKNKVLFFIITGYLCGYLFWFVSLKGGFLYYMLPCAPFMILTVAFVLNKWFYSGGKMLAVLYLATIIVSFVSYYPILNAVVIPKNYFYKLMWLKSWI